MRRALRALAMADKLASAGLKHELLVLSGVNHRFLGKTSEATREANLKALAATSQFVDDTIGIASRTR